MLRTPGDANAVAERVALSGTAFLHVLYARAVKRAAVAALPAVRTGIAEATAIDVVLFPVQDPV